jgi:hypothetical protein
MLPIGPGGPQSGFSTLRYVSRDFRKKNRVRRPPAAPVVPPRSWVPWCGARKGCLARAIKGAHRARVQIGVRFQRRGFRSPIRARSRESESKEESDLLWAREYESKEESDLLWTPESESKGESDLVWTQSPSPRGSPIWFGPGSPIARSGKAFT